MTEARELRRQAQKDGAQEVTELQSGPVTSVLVDNTLKKLQYL